MTLILMLVATQTPGCPFNSPGPGEREGGAGGGTVMISFNAERERQMKLVRLDK